MMLVITRQVGIDGPDNQWKWFWQLVFCIFVNSGSSGNYIGVTGQANTSFGLFADPGGSFTSARNF